MTVDIDLPIVERLVDLLVFRGRVLVLVLVLGATISTSVIWPRYGAGKNVRFLLQV